LIKLTNGEAALLANLRSCINTEVKNSTSSIISKTSINSLKIYVSQQDPYISQQLADTIVRKLSKFIIKYRTNKSKIDLSFINDRTNDAKKQFLESQMELALFKDNNKNIITAKVQTDLDRLQSDYNLKFNIYNNLSIQLEQAKIKVQQNTPALQIIEPSEVPFKKDKPNRLITIIVFGLIGFAVGVGIILIEPIFNQIKNEFKKI
jgi:uncharacterized protein involved in exopolysaccharide biosynthesis